MERGSRKREPENDRGNITSDIVATTVGRRYGYAICCFVGWWQRSAFWLAFFFMDPALVHE